MNKISAVIITKNEQKNILRCLESLKDVADEIIVVDSFSEDDTRDICQKFGTKIYLNNWKGYAHNKNYGNDFASYDHILSLDADEALSPELRASITAAKKDLSDLYFVNRLTNYCGRWVRHCGWYPDKKLRLFNRQKAWWEGDFVHENLVYNSKLTVKHLNGDLLHYSFSSLSEHLIRVDSYSDLAAQKIIAEGKSISLFMLTAGPALKFLKTYFLKKGFLDGFYGFCISIISAFDVFIRYAKAYRLSRGG